MTSTTDLNSYTFNGIKDEPIIVITEDGFKYKGELIEDKGEIYKLFKNYLTSCQTEISEKIVFEFAEWMVSGASYVDDTERGRVYDYRHKLYTTKELFEEFLKSKH